MTEPKLSERLAVSIANHSDENSPMVIMSDVELLDYVKEVAALEREVEGLRQVVKDCVDGLGCQPGYVKAITLQRMTQLVYAAHAKESTREKVEGA